MPKAPRAKQAPSSSQRKSDNRGGYMRDFDSRARPTERKVNFLDATEEEIVDLVRTFVNQLAIASSCLAMPAERRETIEANIASFEAYISRSRPQH
jgi:hypothetical protein